MNRYFIIIILLFGCASVSRFNYDKEKNEILALNDLQRNNHFNKNAKGISDLSSDDFLLVDEGRMFKPTRESQLRNFESYFGAVDIIKWDDVKKPEVRFSKDASVAYVAVEKIVIIKGIGASGMEVIDTSYFSWISIYKKSKSGWELDALASTRKPKI